MKKKKTPSNSSGNLHHGNNLQLSHLKAICLHPHRWGFMRACVCWGRLYARLHPNLEHLKVEGNPEETVQPLTVEHMPKDNLHWYLINKRIGKVLRQL